MTQEEKARAYDEALKCAKMYYKENKDYNAGFLPIIFPELAESEDERHRKWILECLYDGLRKADDQFKEQLKSAIAWLEKQKEKMTAEEYEKSELFQLKLKTKYANGYQDGLVQKEQKPIPQEDFDRAKHEALWGEQKPAEWSEEDKGVLLSIKCVIDEVWHSTSDINIGYSREELKEMWEWLDEIWQRVEYPVHEEKWDKEDEDTLNNILYILNQLKDNIVNPEDKTAEKCIAWLKSLRPSWKPSEEQLEELNKVRTLNPSLDALYQQLKDM